MAEKESFTKIESNQFWQGVNQRLQPKIAPNGVFFLTNGVIDRNGYAGRMFGKALHHQHDQAILNIFSAGNFVIVQKEHELLYYTLDDFFNRQYVPPPPPPPASDSPYRDEVLVDTPIGYWKLSEATGTTAFAIIGPNGTHHATILSQIGAISTDVTNLCIGLADSKYLSTPSQDVGNNYSIEIWAKTNIADSYRFLCNRDGTSSGNRIWQFRFFSPNIQYFHFNNFVTAISYNFNLADNAWHHLVITNEFNETTAIDTTKLYVDGTLRQTVTNASGPIVAGTNDFYWGAPTGLSGGGFWNGNLDEPALYNHALSADRVLAHYNAAQL